MKNSFFSAFLLVFAVGMPVTMAADTRLGRLEEFCGVLATAPKSVVRQIQLAPSAERPDQNRVTVTEVSWNPLQVRQVVFNASKAANDPLEELSIDRLNSGQWYRVRGVSTWSRSLGKWAPSSGELGTRFLEPVIRYARISSLHSLGLGEEAKQKIATMGEDGEIAVSDPEGATIGIRWKDGWIESFTMSARGVSVHKTSTVLADALLQIANESEDSAAKTRGESIGPDGFTAVLDAEALGRASLGLAFLRKDVLVADSVVWKGSAFEAGIAPGDLILSVNGVDAQHDQERAATLLKGSDDVSLTILSPTGERKGARFVKKPASSYIGGFGRLLIIRSRETIAKGGENEGKGPLCCGN